MKQKKYYKTWKFWITSLLALSASSIITSLALTSCVANDNVNKSDIVINSQTEDKEVSVDDNQGLTLSVEATSSKGEDLSYQWYVNKNSSVNENSWEKIAGATQKTYTIPASDLQSATSETTWKYKAEIYHNNDVNKKVESKPISVKIKPSTGGSVPDKPIEPPTPDNPDNQEPTPPVQPPADEKPTPTPPNVDNNKPGIVPSPEHIESQGIGARLPLDDVGVITTKYAQEKWIGDNSLSIAIVAKPNVKGIEDAINAFNSKESSPSIKSLLNGLVGGLNGSSDDRKNYSQFGTGWILDYSDIQNSNLKDYYIATNMHVLSSCFEYKYVSTVYPNEHSQALVDVTTKIPFNKNTVSELSVYISQPQYSTENYKLNLNTYSDQWDNQWYKTNININNWSENLIPVGAYNSVYSVDNKIPTSQSYDMELTWQYQQSNSKPQTLYFKTNADDNNYLANSSIVSQESYQDNMEDFSIFKISLQNNAFDEKINSSGKYSGMFTKMKSMFDTSYINSEINEKSSYIAKLNQLLSIVNSSYDKNKIDKLFMFGDYNNLTNLNTQISMGGYPLITEYIKNDDKYLKKYYTTFNTNTLTGNNIIAYPPEKYHTRNNMGINQYTYKGNLYKVRWRGQGNYILKNVNLMPGSSGSIGIDKNYKLSCINWGWYIHIEYFQGIKYVLDSSTSTGLYSPADKHSLIWKWVTYANQNIKNTKLSQLFNNLENKGYFKN